MFLYTLKTVDLRDQPNLTCSISTIEKKEREFFQTKEAQRKRRPKSGRVQIAIFEFIREGR